MMGYFTTINTLTISALRQNRNNKGLVDLDKDIPQSTSQQFTKIKQIFNVDLEKMKEILKQHGPSKGWSLIKKDPSLLFNDVNEFNNLNDMQKKLLLKELEDFKTKFNAQNREENKTSSDNNIINAGFIDNVKNFFQSAIDKIKDITFNVKKAFVNFLKKFNTQIDAIEKDFNKLDSFIEEDNKLTKQQIDMMKKINEMDQSLINFFNEIKNK